MTRPQFSGIHAALIRDIDADIRRTDLTSLWQRDGLIARLTETARGACFLATETNEPELADAWRTVEAAIDDGGEPLRLALLRVDAVTGGRDV